MHNATHHSADRSAGQGAGQGAGRGARPATERLTVSIGIEDRTVVVSPAGELDQDGVGLLHERLAEALGRDADRVVVDCRDLWFCDSTGLNALLAARRDAQEAGTALVLAELRPTVARMFELTRADTVFDIRPDLGAALSR